MDVHAACQSRLTRSHKTRKGRSPIAEQVFGMYSTHIIIHQIVFELCMTTMKKKENEQNRNCIFGFLNLEKD